MLYWAKAQYNSSKRQETLKVNVIILSTKLHYSTHAYGYGPERAEENPEIPLKVLEKDFENFLRRPLEKVHKNEDVSQFDNARKELILIADKILNCFRKHIEKFVQRKKWIK